MELVKTILDLLHLLGLVLSFGLVLLCDYLLISLITQGEINAFQYGVLLRCSRIISASLQLLILSGLGYLFYYIFNDQRHLLSNPKLIAKEFVVIILCINGYWLHRFGLPILKENIGKKFHQNSRLGFFRKIALMGAISSVSWWTAFVLGTAKILNFKFSIEVFIAIYLLAVLTTVAAVEIYILFIKKKNQISILKSLGDTQSTARVSELTFIETPVIGAGLGENNRGADHNPVN